MKRAKKAARKPAPEAPQPWGEKFRAQITSWVLLIIPLLFGTTTLLQAFVIPTGSMEDTLLIGDHLLVDKLAYAPAGPIGAHLLPYREPKHGDYIVFRSPADLSMTLIKRVIGVPGDRIRLVNKQVYRNGQKLYEPYTCFKTDFIDPYRDNFPAVPSGEVVAGGRMPASGEVVAGGRVLPGGRMPTSSQVTPGGIEMLEHNVVDGEVVVPPGNYFAMGDNRDFSLDSRYWGFVPRANIIGKPILIYWSYEATTGELIGQPVNIDHYIDVVEHFFTKTRWRRTFLLVRGYPG